MAGRENVLTGMYYVIIDYYADKNLSFWISLKCAMIFVKIVGELTKGKKNSSYVQI